MFLIIYFTWVLSDFFSIYLMSVGWHEVLHVLITSRKNSNQISK